ncbi:MAG: hypothetical protein M0P02_02470 [Sulfurospirillaceae bacterium]|nr:hypothetical protein [Sulfurospirillaceae bacterium]MCK9546814.1 hypothetical protein [Sulfurospirillaceae bacterium]MDY0238223.1 hypothetical protein [Campylobacterales bacterium]NLM98818.1 hypothetical protein [Campylobacteraceae bacterium]
MNFRAIKSKFLSAFRHIFVYHHKSLEFRCKLFAAMIVANKNNDCAYEILYDLAKEIYKDDIRVEILLNTTKEYVNKILIHKAFTLDQLLIEIDRELKLNKRFKKKIEIDKLEKFLCDNDEKNYLTQKRILEFLESEAKIKDQI